MSKKQMTITIIVLAWVLVIAAFKIYVIMTPLVVIGEDAPRGKIFNSGSAVHAVYQEVSECAQRQKGLYQYVAAYVEKHGTVPGNDDELLNEDTGVMYFMDCPSGHSYEIRLENYGNPNAVLIAENPNQHTSTFNLWIRGVKPCVRTLGDGTVHLFKGGDFSMTVDASKR